ncbi:MAG: hypothetical protein K0S12_2479, partial [Bacteroidetes bacterium]|nr:hypothetical protein [Bacteroidota bacterium]
ELVLQKFNILVNTLGRAAFPTGIVDGNDSAKRTGERTAETAMIGDCPITEIGFAKVFFYRIKGVQFLIRKRRKFVLIQEFIFRRGNNTVIFFIDQIFYFTDIAFVFDRI